MACVVVNPQTMTWKIIYVDIFLLEIEWLDEYIDELKASVNKNDDKNRLIVKFFINAKSKIILF